MLVSDFFLATLHIKYNETIWTEFFKKKKKDVT